MNNVSRTALVHTLTNYRVPEIRYDLNGDSHLLDLDSQEQLLSLSLKWSDRNKELEAEVFDLVPYEVREQNDIDRGWSCLNPYAHTEIA